MKIRFLNTHYNTGSFNMAVDETLIHSIASNESPPTIRFYGWNSPTLTIGYFQNLKRTINVEYCKLNNIQIVRRLTGGRGVLHFDELTYSFCLPQISKKIPSSVNESYQTISSALVLGLSNLSIHAQLAPKRKKALSTYKSGACFDAPSNYEVTVGGKKIIGSAQIRKKGVLLQHGSVQNHNNINLLSDCLIFNSLESKKNFQTIMEEKSTSLSTILGNSLNFNNQLKAFLDGFQQTFDLDIIFSNSLSNQETKLANELEKKYLSNDWTFKR